MPKQRRAGGHDRRPEVLNDRVEDGRRDDGDRGELGGGLGRGEGDHGGHRGAPAGGAAERAGSGRETRHGGVLRT